MKTRSLTFRVVHALAVLAIAPLSVRADPFAWGTNGNGELGDGTNQNRPLSGLVFTTGALAGKSVVKVAAGGSHNVVLTSDGKMSAWGFNNAGNLGDGTQEQRTVPVEVVLSGVLAGKAIASVTAGQNHNLALTTDGILLAWGQNFHGQLGDGTTTRRLVPVPVIMNGVLAGKSIAAIAAGNDHSVVLTSDGKLFAWGSNGFGQLGDGGGTNSPSPLAVTMNGNLAGKIVTRICAGTYHNIVVTASGEVFGWGMNDSGQLGDGTRTHRNVPSPAILGGALATKTVTAASAGYLHSMLLTSDGTVFTFGSNEFGQLGDGTTIDRTVATTVTLSGGLSGKTVVLIAGGHFHSMALTSDGQLLSWGRNVAGQLGDGTLNDRASPVRVASDGSLAGRTILSFGGGSAHSVAVAIGPEIKVEYPPGNGLTDGAGALHFGNMLTSTQVSRTFTIKNTGDTDLLGVAVTLDGVDAPEFTVTTSPSTTVASRSNTTFTIRFAPLSTGAKTAALQIASSDGDENPFDITLTGRALIADADEDGDGLTNGVEIMLAASGFDPLADNAALAAQLRAAGLYRASDLQTLALGNPVLERNGGTGQFVLRLGLEQSADLTHWTALPGTVDFPFTPAGAAPQFFRVLGRKP